MASGGQTASTGVAPGVDLPPGTMVGEYRIEGPLGEGGMGRVYLAIHPIIGKRAAVKVLRAELSVNREHVERFVQEARAVNQIGHPNIVDIFSFGALPDGRSYFVMELLRGESLRDRLARGRPPLADALAIIEAIAVALAAAHDAGIIHRDLKPDNVFLAGVRDAAAQVKLLDFGIAKLLGPEQFRTERTRTGNVMGTPAYISPEQARGYAVDHRTDLYALGAMAHELLTGDLPFPADNAADMIAMHLYQPPPSPARLVAELPARLDRLVTGLLAKSPDARPDLGLVRATIDAARAELELGTTAPPTATVVPAVGVPLHTPAPEAAPAPPRSSWVIPAVAAAVIAVGLGTYYLLRRAHDPAPAAVTAPAPAPPPAVSPPAVTPPAVTPPEPVHEVATGSATAAGSGSGSAAATVEPAADPTPIRRRRDKGRDRHRGSAAKPAKGSAAAPPPDDDDAPM